VIYDRKHRPESLFFPHSVILGLGSELDINTVITIAQALMSFRLFACDVPIHGWLPAEHSGCSAVP